MEKPPFHSAALQFALNNNPNAVSLSALLSAAQASEFPAARLSPGFADVAQTPQIPPILFPSSVAFAPGLQDSLNGSASCSSSVSPPASSSGAAVFRAPPNPCKPSGGKEPPKSAKKSKGCNFCGAISSQCAEGLTECENCSLVVYCSAEHKAGSVFGRTRFSPFYRFTFPSFVPSTHCRILGFACCPSG